MNLEDRKMAIVAGDELLEAHAHITKHATSFINSMSLKCAVELGIPDAIHNHGPHPMPLSQLVSALQLNPNKTAFMYRLMRLLTHSGFFQVSKTSEEEEGGGGYMLTNSSRVLVTDNPSSIAPILFMLDPVHIKPWQFLSTWFRSDDETPFDTAHGMPIWEYMGNQAKDNDGFNAAMASESKLAMSVLMEKYKDVFCGLNSLVDVGGGIGTVAKAIAEAFPETECIVFDLPHVVADFKGERNFKYVGGDMFKHIPPADAILLRCVLHDWNNEECVKILKKCKSAITCNGNKGKVIVIDMVVDSKKKDSIETQLIMDLLMITIAGRERKEKEFAKLIKEAGFSSYKIFPILGLRSLIEIYP